MDARYPSDNVQSRVFPISSNQEGTHTTKMPALQETSPRYFQRRVARRLHPPRGREITLGMCWRGGRCSLACCLVCDSLSPCLVGKNPTCSVPAWVGMRGSTVVRLRPCTEYTPPSAPHMRLLGVGRVQLIPHATRRTPQGASRLVQALSA